MGSRYAYPALFAGVLIESTVFPWPVELMIAGMMLEGRRHVFPVWLVTVTATVLGAGLSFLVGAYLFDSLGAPVIEALGWQDAFEEMRRRFQDYSFWIIFLASQTPVPFQVTALAAGVAGVGIGPFLAAALIGRGLRYALMAVPVYLFGPAIRGWWQTRPAWVRQSVIAAAVIVFIAALILPFLP